MVEPSAQSLNRGPVRVAALFAVGWLVGLAALAVWTANPVVFNTRQISEADAVVAVVDGEVIQSWAVRSQEGPAGIVSWEGLREGPQLVPVRRVTGEEWEIVPVVFDPNRGPEPLVYADTPRAREQLEAAIAALRSARSSSAD